MPNADCQTLFLFIYLLYLLYGARGGGLFHRDPLDARRNSRVWQGSHSAPGGHPTHLLPSTRDQLGIFIPGGGGWGGECANSVPFPFHYSLVLL